MKKILLTREYRKPNGLMFTEDEIKKFTEASESLARDYPMFSKDEILTHIGTIAGDLKRAKERTKLNRRGENSLIELTKLKKFIKGIVNEGEYSIIIKSKVRNESFEFTGEYPVFKTINYLRSLDSPDRDTRQRGGQEGELLCKRILIEHKQSLYTLYRYGKNFKSDNQLYLYIIDILSAAGYKAKNKKIKLSLSTLKSLPIIKTARTNK